MTLSLVAGACGKKEEKTEEKPQQQTEEKEDVQVNARVQEIEKTLMEQIGDMPDFSKGGQTWCLSNFINKSVLGWNERIL